jgi:hypothetical protein
VQLTRASLFSSRNLIREDGPVLARLSERTRLHAKPPETTLNRSSTHTGRTYPTGHQPDRTAPFDDPPAPVHYGNQRPTGEAGMLSSDGAAKLRRFFGGLIKS